MLLNNSILKSGKNTSIVFWEIRIWNVHNYLISLRDLIMMEFTAQYGYNQNEGCGGSNRCFSPKQIHRPCLNFLKWCEDNVQSYFGILNKISSWSSEKYTPDQPRTIQFGAGLLYFISHFWIFEPIHVFKGEFLKTESVMKTQICHKY